MLLGLVSILSIIVGLIGAAVWLLTRRPAAAPAPKATAATPTPAAVTPAATTPSLDATGTLWVIPGQQGEPTVEQPPAPEVEPLSSAEIYTRLHQLSLGTGTSEAWPGAHDELISATADTLQNASTEDRYTPRRPSLLPQLLRAVNDEEVSRRELVTIISRDPSLVGNLLKMANSPFYRVSAQAVESIDRAVVILAKRGAYG